MPPKETGLVFANVLPPQAGAENRVLENGSGVAVGDYDEDGRPDIFMCSLEGNNALYHNLGSWKFEDVTAKSGLNATQYVCRGAVFGDINGDKHLDLLISTLDRGVLCFINQGNGVFVNATASAGTETRLGAMTMALADVDGNGTLDLYVANYRTSDIRDLSRVEVQMVNGKMTLPPKYRDRLILTKNSLIEYGDPDVLYLNDGQGRFSPVPSTSGAFCDESGAPLSKPPLDWGLTATFRDINGDGAPDIYVCNDYWTPDRVWINDGKGHFKSLDILAIRHTSENSMGVDIADIDRDGRVDMFVLDMISRDPAMRKRQSPAQTRMQAVVGEIANRPQIMRNILLRQNDNGSFVDIADYAGVEASDWSWQPLFLDIDLDGYEDIIIAAGHQRDVQDMDATMRIKSMQHSWPKDMDPKARQAAFTRERAEQTFLYPQLKMPIVAYWNLGNCRFKEMTREWGFDALRVHQGFAAGDFDGDGDLDFVVNNLNSPCSLYRNEGIGTRIAIRLKGIPPNTQGIGAHVKLLNGAVSMQSQEMVCGGRYLSGGDAMLVFACGKATNGMTVEVRWRNGKTSVISNVFANRLYEIDERYAIQTRKPVEARKNPLFQNISDRIDHQHVENTFDDFARQPLLPKKISQMGPGIAWADLNEDGFDDLIIGSGTGGFLGVFLNDCQGGFKRNTEIPIGASVTRDQTGILAMHLDKGHAVILAGSSSYEDGQADTAWVKQYDLQTKQVDDSLKSPISSAGPLALADMDGDGDLDLFVGGRTVPGRYPEPASSRIYLRQNEGWKLDIENSHLLEKIGMVSGAIWSDLDRNGFPELALACEWGPIRIFHNKAGRLTDATTAWGMSSFTGWWSGVAAGDFDGDGNVDLIAGNWGLNSSYHASHQEPLRLYYGDFNGQGGVDILETEYDSPRKRYAPRYRLDYVASGLPWIREKFPTFKEFSEASIDVVIGSRTPVTILEASTLASTVFLNRGQRFDAVELPAEAQFAPVFGVNIGDADGDGCEDVFLSQNFFALPWEHPRMDGGKGLWLLGNGKGQFRQLPAGESGISILGEQRGAALSDFNGDGRVDLAVTQNGASTQLFINNGAKPGLRVRLRGREGNPTGVGAIIRWKHGERWGPAREIHAGSGYWSQDSAVQVLGYATPPTELEVTWPGGKTCRYALSKLAQEITVDEQGTVSNIK